MRLATIDENTNPRTHYPIGIRGRAGIGRRTHYPIRIRGRAVIQIVTRKYTSDNTTDADSEFAVLCDTGALSFKFISSKLASELGLDIKKKEKKKFKLRFRTAENRNTRIKKKLKKKTL